MSATQTQPIFISTAQLIEIIKQTNVIKVEAATVLAGGLARCSHVISYNDGIVYDIGIDDEEVEWPEADFATGYEGSLWIVDDVERHEEPSEGEAS
jgi:hypothetical protein